MNCSDPLVTVLTPVYNGEKYLIECIDSVLNQNYKNFEYIIVNNCSTDATLDIASGYAEKDIRIKIVNNSNFVGVIENHNIAFKLIAPESKYCKIVSADDMIYPEAISRLVEVAELNQSIGIVGSYVLHGSEDKWLGVMWGGLPYRSSVVSGSQICRSTLLGGQRVFGSPTALLYRSDLVRTADSFYPNLAPQADLSACYKYLQNTDFGFVHQVLSYERVHNESVTSQSVRKGTYEIAFIRDLLEYGPTYLTELEFNNRLDQVLLSYYDLLADSIFNFKDLKSLSYQKKTLKELGYPFISSKLAKAVLWKIIDLLFNPKKAIGKMFRQA